MMMMIMVMQFLCDVDLLLGTAVTQNVMNGKWKWHNISQKYKRLLELNKIRGEIISFFPVVRDFMFRRGSVISDK